MALLPERHRPLVAQALDALGVRNLVLSIQDASLPSEPGEDTGRGSSCARGAARFWAFVHALGFTGVQLGPQGQTTDYNPSPYDGTLFSRNVLNVSLAELTDAGRWGALLPEARVEALVAARPARAGPGERYRYAFHAQRAALDEAWATFRQRRARGADAALAEVARRLEDFTRQHREWLLRDGLFEVLLGLHGHMEWRRWPGVDARLFSPEPGEEAEAQARLRQLRAAHAEALERQAFQQFLAHAQHGELRQRAARLGLKLYGDLQIGLSPGDAWALRGLFLRGYLLGAPPSRTNPEGQPWNYAVLDPEQYFEPRTEEGPAHRPGPVPRYLDARLDKMLDEYDGLRIDHPHGLVCPWVYRADEPDASRAVRGGARLFSSPDLPEHPGLARYALVRPEQLERSVPRYADGWVRSLTPEQVRRYSLLFDSIIQAARRHGRDTGDVLCEVLSTQPYPLKRVVEQYGLGRFRVTQKANLEDASDVYRAENAAPQDWVMVGNHDTRSLWRVAEGWRQAGALGTQAQYLAWRLHPQSQGREALARRLAGDVRALVEAKFADLFVSRARNVMVFFTDLLGQHETYNEPGTFHERNWTLRVPEDWAGDYRQKLTRGEALNLPRVLALALRARGEAARHGELLAGLEALADELSGARPPPGAPAG